MANAIDLSRAAADFERDAVRDRVAQAAAERRHVAEEFPLDQWPSLPLERYALGAGSDDGTVFCRLMEFGTDALGSIRGGSAAKHIIYRHNDGSWRLSGRLADLDTQPAWEQVRSEFVAAFEAAAKEDFEALDGLQSLRFGQALVTKALASYFPQHFLPVYSAEHLKHFIELFGGSAYQTYGVWSGPGGPTAGCTGSSTTTRRSRGGSRIR